MSVLATENESAEEVLDKEISYIETKYCDGCGASVNASYEAKKEGRTLFFCGHHIRKHAENLKADGFEIIPEDISYEAKIIVESTQDV